MNNKQSLISKKQQRNINLKNIIRLGITPSLFLLKSSKIIVLLIVQCYNYTIIKLL